MSDVSDVSEVRVLITRFKGLVSATTYNRVAELLNRIHGESDSLKAELGRKSADITLAESVIETVSRERDEARELCSRLGKELEQAREEINSLRVVKVPEPIDPAPSN